MKRGEWDLQGIFTWTNHWAQRAEAYRVDMEVVRKNTLVRHALTETLQLSLEAPVIWRGGGIMDGLIEEFHDRFALPGANRDDFPQGRLHVEFSRYGRQFELLRERDEGRGLGDLVLSAQRAVFIAGEREPTVGVGLSLKLPTANQGELYGNGGGMLVRGCASARDSESAQST